MVAWRPEDHKRGLAPWLDPAADGQWKGALRGQHQRLPHVEGPSHRHRSSKERTVLLLASLTLELESGQVLLQTTLVDGLGENIGWDLRSQNVNQ